MSEKISLFVPGRLCLFGEHSDWAGLMRSINADIAPGASIVTGIEQGIYATAEKADKFLFIDESGGDNANSFESEMNIADLKKTAMSESYFAYVAGVASYILENYNVGGVKITITKMTLPVKSGLSSSAAICVLVSRAFSRLYNLNMSTLGEMQSAFKGEQRTKSRCGRLDQACAFGVNPVLMTFDAEDIEVERLVVKEPLYWVFADVGGTKDTIKILSDLNSCFPFAKSDVEADVQSALGSENLDIISRAANYIKSGQVQKLGQLMTEAQELFDRKVAPASAQELASPKLHALLADKTAMSLSYGGKGVGSQGDGSVQFLAKDEACQRKLVEYLLGLGLSASSLTIEARRSVHKAIVPVAGFGTRLYPTTRAIKKEFIPVVDSDGFVKPVILVILEQLYDSGIDEICMIVGSNDDIDDYKKFFLSPLSDEHRSKLPSRMKEYEKKILDIGKLLTFRIQEERRGFGHAIYQARDFCGDEPVLLLLGDTVYRSNAAKSCSEQLIEAYEMLNCPLVAIHAIPSADVVHYGILSGSWDRKDETVLKVSEFVEKPTIEYARDFLGTKRSGGAIGAAKELYFSVFGQYILTPEVFSKLDTSISTGAATEKGGEFGLTAAIASLIDDVGVYGVLVDGEMFDTGNAEAYKRAIREF